VGIKGKPIASPFTKEPAMNEVNGEIERDFAQDFLAITVFIRFFMDVL
jgi:hypothetical protein